MISIRFTCNFSFTLILLLLLPILFYSHTVIATEPLVNINQAGAEELAEKLSGIGPAKAKAILMYRDLHGPFKSVDELIKVKGIGPRTLEKIRAQLIVYANHQLVRDHTVIAANASGNAKTLVNRENKTRHAVRAVIEAARRDSARPRY